ncbi:MAG: hypothetical protein RLY16_2664 [Bacteroidota bacterium]|jgi:sulfite exporter TauE/SafE
MEQLFGAAFGMGLLGSLHCIGMCGPLALSLPISGESSVYKFAGAAIYNLGRVITYSIMGIIFGMIGKTVSIAGYQQWLSILAGLVILFLVLAPGLMGKHGPSFLNKYFDLVRNTLARFFQQNNLHSLLFTGMLNGLLPCGLVYMAMAGALATGDILDSMLFMAFFGAGTLPMMWGVIYFGNFISFQIRSKIRKAYPVFLSLTACLLIVRGLGLGIPYLSPKENIVSHEVICCPKP